MPPHRKVPFSNKQKKEQLKAKRERKQELQRPDDGVGSNRNKDKSQRNRLQWQADDDGDDSHSDEVSSLVVQKLNQQPAKQHASQVNRYQLHFRADTDEDIEAGKRSARQKLTPVPQEALELGVDDVYPDGVSLSMPKRPPWDYSFSTVQLDTREQEYFKTYVSDTVKLYNDRRQNGYFELNLETWRQLWRVIEMSDIILLIADIRFPALHFSPSLYDHVVNDLNKHLILILNKIDLAPIDLVIAWKHYFNARFPKLHVVCFTSHPSNFQTAANSQGLRRRKQRTKRNFNAVGPLQLLETCELITSGAVNLDTWRSKIAEDAANRVGVDLEAECEIGEVVDEHSDTRQKPPQQLYQNGILTIGCCGYPNVGKSSLINGLMGKKVVSVSRTPGHTKHFQTIFLTDRVRLCDCPGLVFPSFLPRPLQILSGIYPVAQLREPYSVVKYLAERIPVVDSLRVKHPETEGRNASASAAEPPVQWTAFDICEAWALKRGFLTAKAARPDVYRAANNILRLAIEGRLCLCLRPRHYTANREEWLQHADTVQLIHMLGVDTSTSADLHALSSASDEDQEESSDDVDDDDKKKLQTGDSSDEIKLSTNNPFDLLSDDN